MQGLNGIDNRELAAVRFPDEATFREAARRAATRKIPVDAPGRNTLILRSKDIEAVLKGLKYEAEDLSESHKIPDKERSDLRRRLR